MGYVAVTVPDWADTLLDVIGVSWPNIDEDAYRDMADSLREFAEDLEDDGQLANGHVERLLSSGYGEALDALNLHWGKVKGTHIKDIASAARTIAGALDTAATAVEGMKGAAIVQLGYLASEAGIALSLIPVTGGLSALLGAGAIRATQEAVRRLIKECAEEAVGYIVAALTEPAVAALENLAADLVVQVGATAMGLRDGVDLGQAQQAGKEGFKDGVQGAKEGMHLASAGAPAGGGGGNAKGLRIDHGEHDHASTQLSGLSVNFHTKTAGKLSKAKSHHGRTRGRDSIAEAIDPVADKAMDALEKALKTMGDHVSTKLPKAVKQISTDNKNNDIDIGATFGKKRRDDDGRQAPKGGKGGASHVKPNSLRDAKDDPRGKGIPLNKRRCLTDPVDLASGEMVLPQTDLALPGVLPLVLRRTHISSYRYGQWFGRSWASTLDERIELDPLGGGAIWAREDGSLLVYPRLPRPQDPEPVMPLEGPRLPLSFGEESNAETSYRITDPDTGLTRWFTGSPYSASIAYWLSEIEDRNNNRIAFDRRGDGSPIAVTHDGGYQALLNVQDSRIRELALRTPDGPVTVMTYGYDEQGNLDAVTNSSGLPLRFTYDPDGRITSWTDRNNSTYQYLYDTAGRIARTTGPDGYLSSAFTYDTEARTTHYTDSTGATSVYQLNERLQVVAETDPLGATTRFEFDLYDRLLAQTDALGHTTRLERDTHGCVVGLIAPDGVRTTATYNALRLPIEVIERGGIQHGYVYDDRGNLTASIEPTGARTEYEFNHRGHLTALRNAVGDVTRFATNRAGLPMHITAPDGTTATCSRDPFGRITTVTDALGGSVRQEWTVEGKPAWRELADGTREVWTWDGEGNLLTHTDRMGRTTAQTVTHFDRAATTQAQDGGTYQYTHDTELRLTKVTNPQGLEWQYTYDAAGRLIAETDFDGRTLSYEHDAVGRLVRRTNAAGQSLTYQRDVLGRVTGLQHDDGSLSSIAYDETGHVREITNPHARITLDHDRAGRVVAETVNGRTLTLAYDALGRRTHRRTPSGADSTLAYTHSGLAAYTAGDHTFHFDRDPLGRETARHLDNGLALRQDWDPVGRLVHQKVSTTEADLLERAFTYQADGAPVAIDDSLSGRRTYTLDAASRITAVQARGWSEQYAYNTAGDQTHTALPARAPGQESAGDRVYDGTRLTRAGRTRYGYDAQGRITLRQMTTLSGKRLTWHFTWDAEDRLTHVEAPGGVRWRYVYDATGRRIGKRRLDDEGRTVEAMDYCWDGAQLAEQRTDDTTLVWDYTGLRPLAQRERKTDSEQREIDRRFFAIVSDLSGSPTELLAPDGSLAWRTRATAWGATQRSRGSTAYTPLRWPGQYFDAETGLHYNVNRYYDPGLGRYITPDPLGLAPAANHYAYVANPLTLIDPLGLAGCEADPTWGGRVQFVREDGTKRPFEMHATITRDMLDEGTDARNSLRPPGFIHGDEGHARGHMLANRLGGSGDTLDNLFTITQNPTNTPDMSKVEDAIYRAVAGDPARGIPGQIVQYSVYLEYTDDKKDSVPKWITMEADGDGGFHIRADFENPDHTEQQHRRRLGTP
ncbi:RHS repeat-associated core domain-containing protein [Streptomyces sp. NPDC019937]|uniref:RHS repeat-associated core domain-containing protein n=1 Tax=Streptomyces sp. NPDC019937 TaxID=3154787 RepID=UPI0033DD0C33